VSPGAVTVPGYSKFARGDIHLTSSLSRTLGPGGKTDPLGKAFDPVTNGDPCSMVSTKPGSDSILLSSVSKGFTLAGATTITAKLKENKKFGQIDARLWDVSKGQRRLIDEGVYRVNKGQKGKITFQLLGNEYTFAKGHTVQLELVGHNSPSYLSDKSFKAKLSSISADVPTRDKPSRKRGIGKPPKRH